MNVAEQHVATVPASPHGSELTLQKRSWDSNTSDLAQPGKSFKQDHLDIEGWCARIETIFRNISVMAIERNDYHEILHELHARYKASSDGCLPPAHPIAHHFG